ncbi:hypothetical protein BDN72DRAFT_846385 [Pluteus cervinus]|uniref:Uncharacterized protein n=1 Tax=Pluteus cervinus TaxID=181527 RepID=A0ACD3AGG0_9AGAR|nr:hypothetical protein BDN72DRAFT_846385 [Pluteus cervinus]
MASKSGLQKEVLALYRRALRITNSKPPQTRSKFRLFVRYTFHMNAANVSPREVGAVEYLLRKGKRQIEAFEDPAVKDCWVSGEMRAWDQTRNKRMPAQPQSS